jgi:hypothetical protein
MQHPAFYYMGVIGPFLVWVLMLALLENLTESRIKWSPNVQERKKYFKL